MNQHRYNLTLSVEDYGKRTFTASSDSDCQEELSKSLACDISRMLEILNSPPSSAEIMVLTDRCDPFLQRMANLYSECWDGNNDFKAAFKVVLDLDILMPHASNEKLSTVQIQAESVGIKTTYTDRLPEQVLDSD